MGIQGRTLDQPRALPEMVAPPVCLPVQDAHPGGSRPTRLPARCLRGLPTLHHVAAAESAIKDALLSRRRPLGLEAPKQPALVQDGGRVGGLVSQEVKRIWSTAAPGCTESHRNVKGREYGWNVRSQ